MASGGEASCANDPNFAIICAFFEKFSTMLNIEQPDIRLLQDWLENTDEVPTVLRDLHIKLLRKMRKTVHETAWESALVKFCYLYSAQDAWEIERFGYKKASLKVKLRILTAILEYQFQLNGKFRNKFSNLSAEELRSEPIGRDRLGHSYWLTQDPSCNFRIYQEHLDEEIWQTVASNRAEMETLISRLKGNEVVLPSLIGVVDEDSSSNSCPNAIIKQPPPEQQDDSQSSSCSSLKVNKVPNIKIKLDVGEMNGIVTNGNATAKSDEADDDDADNADEADDDGGEEEESEDGEEEGEEEEEEEGEEEEDDDEEDEKIKPNPVKNGTTVVNGTENKSNSKKMKPIVISQSKLIVTPDEKKKRPLDDGGAGAQESTEEPAPKKTRPTLLDNRRDKKSKYEKSSEDDEDGEEEDDEGEEEEDEEDADDDEEEEAADEENEVGEEIEEEVLVVKGEGSGKECESSSLIPILGEIELGCDETDEPVGDAIEEEVMYIYGEGSGKECQVGNKGAAEETSSLLQDASNRIQAENKETVVKETLKDDCPAKEKNNCEKEQKNGEAEEQQTKDNGNPAEKAKSNEEEGRNETDVAKSQEEKCEIAEDLTISEANSTKTGAKAVEENARNLSNRENDSVVTEKPLTETSNDESKKSKSLEANLEEVSKQEVKVEAAVKPAKNKASSNPVPVIVAQEPVNKPDDTATASESAAANTRKRRLSEGQVRHSSESESDLNSDSAAPPTEEDEDIGGKRPKMRMKVINNELRKKIEKSRRSDERHDSTSEEDVPETSSVNNNKPLVGIESKNETPKTSKDEPDKADSVEKEADATQDVVLQTRTTRRTPAGTPIKVVAVKPRCRKKSITGPLPPQSADAKPVEIPTLQPENSDPKEPVDYESILPDVMPKLEPETNGTTSDVQPKPSPAVQEEKPSPAARKVRTCKREIDTNNIIDNQLETPVRQSRRIAQLKIREEAERRKLEEVALKKMKAEFKKKKKEESKTAGYEPPPSESSSEEIDSDAEASKKAMKKQRGGKGKKDRWSSGPDDEPEEEEEYEMHHDRYESDRGSPLFKSDHEFSPESDIEDESQAVPLKRARTARKEGADSEDEADLNESCQKCGKKDHPEWILLCDKCDKGYHCSCLSPVLFYIPEGDWFCPPCQQESLISSLGKQLIKYDELVEQKRINDEQVLKAQKAEMERKLKEKEAEAADVEKQEIVAPAKKSREERAKRRRAPRVRKSFIVDEDDETEESEAETSASNDSSSGGDSVSKSNSASGSDSDDVPIYKLRKRRQINVSYRLNEYDDLIDSAIKEEMDEVAGAGNLGRGKDISTIIEADKEEKMRQKNLDAMKEASAEQVADEAKPEVTVEEKVAAKKETAGSDSDDFNPVRKIRKPSKGSRRKGRKLNNLEISSDDDGSDEDFKTSSYETEEDDDDSISAQTDTDSSLEVYRRKGNKKNKKSKEQRRPRRRAARERRRMDDFIVDDSELSDDSTKKKKVQRRVKRKHDWELRESDDTEEDLSEQIDSEELCDDSSDSEDSDGCWRPSKRRKTKTAAAAKKPTTAAAAAAAAKGGKQPRKFYKKDLSEKPFKTKAKITKKYGSDDSDDEDTPRTRGKRFAYLDMDFEDESSDDGIKPGVKRPDTPPEEREKFIKKQEEIKRMLAEKNTEAAKAVATPTLAPVDSLSTVPLSVIKGAKALDVEYLQRKGELPSDDGDTDFDEDLPDDFDPEDMDEEEIAKMMEEEDFAQQQIKVSDTSRPKKKDEVAPIEAKSQSVMQSVPMAQEIQRKRLPMPTIPPPLNSARFPPPSAGAMYMSQMRQGPHMNQMSYPMQSPSLGQIAGPPANPSQPLQSTATPAGQALGTDQFKPRGRRKKITPLRDTLQKQQAAAAAAAASVSTTSITAKEIPQIVTGPKLSVAQPPQLYTPPTNTPPSVITRMPQPQGPPHPQSVRPQTHPPRSHFPPEQNSRFYSPNQMPPHRLPLLRHGSPMPPQHHPLGPSYAGGPPPSLRPASPRMPVATVGSAINRQPSPRQLTTFSGNDQYPVRPPHPNQPHTYRPPLYGTPGYPPAPPPQQSQQTAMHPTTPDYAVPPTSYGPTPAYGPYYPPPPPPQSLGPTHSNPPPPTVSAIPVSSVITPVPVSSVITSVLPTPTTTSVSIAQDTPLAAQSPSVAAPVVPPPSQLPTTPAPRPKATAFETYDKKSTSPLLETEVNSNPYPNQSSVDEIDEEENSIGRSPPNTTSEFSGLVSYFSSQHDDLNS